MKRSRRSSRKDGVGKESDSLDIESGAKFTPQEIEERKFLSTGQEVIEIKWQHLVEGSCGCSQVFSRRGEVVCLNPVDRTQERSLYLDPFSGNMGWNKVCKACYEGAGVRNQVVVNGSVYPDKGLVLGYGIGPDGRAEVVTVLGDGDVQELESTLTVDQQHEAIFQGTLYNSNRMGAGNALRIGKGDFFGVGALKEEMDSADLSSQNQEMSYVFSPQGKTERLALRGGEGRRVNGALVKAVDLMLESGSSTRTNNRLGQAYDAVLEYWKRQDCELSNNIDRVDGGSKCLVDKALMIIEIVGDACKSARKVSQLETQGGGADGSGSGAGNALLDSYALQGKSLFSGLDNRRGDRTDSDSDRGSGSDNELGSDEGYDGEVVDVENATVPAHSEGQATSTSNRHTAVGRKSRQAEGASEATSAGGSEHGSDSGEWSADDGSAIKREVFSPGEGLEVGNVTPRQVATAGEERTELLLPAEDLEGKYWAVQKGLRPGVYTTGTEAAAATDGVARSRQRRFASKEEAWGWVQRGMETLKKTAAAATKATSREGSRRARELALATKQGEGAGMSRGSRGRVKRPEYGKLKAETRVRGLPSLSGGVRRHVKPERWAREEEREEARERRDRRQGWKKEGEREDSHKEWKKALREEREESRRKEQAREREMEEREPETKESVLERQREPERQRHTEGRCRRCCRHTLRRSVD